MVQTGLDRLVSDEFSALKGRVIGVVCNQASIDSSIDHILDLLQPLHRAGFLRVQAVFGPQHGLGGHTQDNMIEWEGGLDAGAGWPVYSLYGQHREPTAAMLDGIELMVIDLQDAGARYYTFIWTMALCMKACETAGIPMLVLDRPNPIGGVDVEGTLLRPEFSSFVGVYPLPTRHGMTIGEIARYLSGSFFPRCRLDVLAMAGWRRGMSFDHTGLPWVMPSPNLPTVDTAFVYPGGCLFEATNLSEGRGTTRPFEMVGAPYLDAHRFCAALNGAGLEGVKFRPIEFEPTFNKHARMLCGGCFIHVLDQKVYRPVLSTIAVLQEAILQSEGRFEWKLPPYEYENEKRPIDILAGNGWLADSIERLAPLQDIAERFRSECEEFDPARRAVLEY